MALLARGSLSLRLPGQGVCGQGARPSGAVYGKGPIGGALTHRFPDSSHTEDSSVITEVLSL